MTLLEPAWLLLALPLGVFLGRRRPPPGTRRALRIALLSLVVLALARPALRLPRRGGTLVVVADRSASMPLDSRALQEEIVGRLEASRGSSDRLAVVSFGVGTAVERTASGTPFDGFRAEVGSEQSNLADAIDVALGLAPLEESGRLLLLTDGRFTGRDPAAGAARAAVRDVALDYLPAERPATRDLAVERIEAPRETSPGEGFLVTAWIRSPVRQVLAYELRRGDQVLIAGSREIASGRSRLTFRDRAGAPGVRSYSLTLSPPDGDPWPENNTARFLVGVRGPRPLAVVSDAPSGLARLLRDGGLEVRDLRPHELSGSFEQLGGVSAVVLDNVLASDVGLSALESLAAWVEAGGGGLWLTGGRRSFGQGGYFRSPLDPVLPVSMELRQEHRKLALAMVVALDRSGSMGMTVPGGRTKMELADLATAEVLGLLSPIDELAVVAVDSRPHIVLPLRAVRDQVRAKETILRIDSQGGGIFVYQALLAASEQLLRSRAGARHILLFADAADAEEPGAYRELLARCVKAGITVSVVGLGTPADPDAELLRDVARRGRGEVYFTNAPRELPRLFAQDTFTVARSAYVDESTTFRFTAALATLTGRSFGDPPPARGYNLTYLRDGAHLAAVTGDEYRAPVVAGWQVGLGRALATTFATGGPATGNLGGWPEAGDLHASLARWTAGEDGGLPPEMVVTQELRNGLLQVRLHLDPERSADPFTRLPRASVLRGVPGRRLGHETETLRWSDPDTLAGEVLLEGDEVALVTVEVPGVGTTTLSPVRLPYSPEFAPAEAGSGHLVLERLARSTGGRRRLDVGRIWDDFPRRPRRVDLRPWLAALSLVLLLAEILERRTGLISASLPGWTQGISGRVSGAAISGRAPRAAVPSPQSPAGTADRPSPATSREPQTPVRTPVRKGSPSAPPAVAGEPSEEQPAEPAADVMTALSRARRRAQRRRRRER